MRIISTLFSLVLLLLGALAPAAAEDSVLPAAERSAIKSVIEQQIAAFAKDDAAAAFSFASPMIQQQFGSPETFLRMVQDGYRAVYRPRSLRFGEVRRTTTGMVQEVDVIGPDGDGRRAFYLMEQQADGSWRINGVTLAPGNEKEA
jgi:ketosteroid isomerase-like protein